MRIFRSCYFFLLLLSLLWLTSCSSALNPSPTKQIAKNRPIQAATVPLTPEPQVQEPAPLDMPVRLQIPAIHVDASIEPVGITSSGNLATATQHPWEDVGWFDGGPLPGHKGSSVIDGHLDRPGGTPAVFWFLNDLHTGDEISVYTRNGKHFRFMVNQVKFYLPTQAPLQTIFGKKDGAFLNLITCAGDWIPSQHQTTLRLVVYATLI